MPYSCKKCGREFNSRPGLWIHSKRANCDSEGGDRIILQPLAGGGVKQHKCPHCGKCCKAQGALTMHIRTHTSIRKCFKCEYCNQTFPFHSVYRSHLKTHAIEKPYKCEQCGKAFGHVDSLDAHGLVHSGGKPYICDKCDETFDNDEEWDLHLDTHDSSDLNPTAPPVDEDDPDYVPSGDIPINTGTPSIFSPTRKYGGSSVMPFECTTCRKKFRYRSTLMTHQRSHTGEKPYRCNICDEEFRAATLLKIHIKRSHSDVGGHCCHFCGKLLANSVDLQIHLLGHRRGRMPRVQKCAECKRPFKSIAELKKHLLANHAPKLPPLLTDANENSGDQLDLEEILQNSAERSHTDDWSVDDVESAPPTLVKERICVPERLLLSTPQKNNASQDDASWPITPVRSHTGADDYCDEESTSSGGDVKPIVCTVCRQVFGSDEELQEHGVEHERQKGFSCGQCGLRFDSPALVVEHIKYACRCNGQKEFSLFGLNANYLGSV